MAMRKAKKGEGVAGRKSVLIEVGPFKVLEDDKGIEVVCEFEISASAVSKLTKMRRKYVTFLPAAFEGQIEEREYEFSGELRDITVPKAPKKTGKLKLHFPETAQIIAALRHIRGCNPPQILLEQTQMDLEFESEQESETGQSDIED